jgi:hypothetical protein
VPELIGRLGVQHAFNVIEGVSVVAFTLEYLARLYSCPDDPDYNTSARLTPRWSFALSAFGYGSLAHRIICASETFCFNALNKESGMY